MSKTDKIFEILKKKVEQIDYGEWPIKLVIHNGELVGFDEIDRPLIRVRLPAKENNSKQS